MTVSVASGKGGTGKTTVAVNLALSLGGPLELLDCDVEEPNAHLFLRPRWTDSRTVSVPVPQVDERLCTACGACGAACRFHAIVSLKTQPLVFPELCHGCGACLLACPAGAIREVPREVGVVESGCGGGLRFVHGRLKVGTAMSGPLIRAVKAEASGGRLTLIDSPPGTSCPVVAAVRGSDFVVLVTEPTPFGLNDLRLAVDMVRALGLFCGVVLNRSDIGDGAVREYCASEGVPLLMELPEDRRVAEAYSRGRPAVFAVPRWRGLFRELGRRLLSAVARAGQPSVLAGWRGRCGS
jgi:MinD superfamily P-loop ATPase